MNDAAICSSLLTLKDDIYFMTNWWQYIWLHVHISSNVSRNIDRTAFQCTFPVVIVGDVPNWIETLLHLNQLTFRDVAWLAILCYSQETNSMNKRKRRPKNKNKSVYCSHVQRTKSFQIMIRHSFWHRLTHCFAICHLCEPSIILDECNQVEYYVCIHEYALVYEFEWWRHFVRREISHFASSLFNFSVKLQWDTFWTYFTVPVEQRMFIT